MDRRKRAVLALADGTVFEGYSFGATGEVSGEVVFNTSICGYQEVLTDPSYRGQMVVMTYTQIGNYGTNEFDAESDRPWLAGFIVKEPSSSSSSWRSTQSLEKYLERYGIVGIYGLDTRALTRHIRDKGAMEGVISTVDEDYGRLVKKALDLPGLIGRDLVKEVTCREPYGWSEGIYKFEPGRCEERTGGGRKVVVYDFGVKYNILRNLVEVGFDIVVVPGSSQAEDVLAMDPVGVVLSNGPGDPSAVTYAIDNVRLLIGKMPILGICFGHQILALALGGRTYKLKFGHRGGNQPVFDVATGKVEITSQNHGFAVDAGSLEGLAEITHVNLNDDTVEGLVHGEHRLLSVQYHPEAAPGPNDSAYIFGRFCEMVGYS